MPHDPESGEQASRTNMGMSPGWCGCFFGLAKSPYDNGKAECSQRTLCADNGDDTQSEIRRDY